MQKIKISFLVITAFICGCRQGNSVKFESVDQPNIIYILADDLGYGDLGCYGQTRFETPNLDRLAAEGIRFTQHYSGSSVCAPSRSSLMTGQHTGHTPIRGNKEFQPEGQEPLPASSVTVAEILKHAGYQTAAFGKWGLGFVGAEGDPQAQGFDYFFGYNCQRQAHRYYPTHLWRNNEKVNLPGNDLSNTATYAQDEIHKEALRYIEDHKEGPFFMYLPYVIPHAEIIAPDDSLFHKYADRFEEKPFIGKPGADYGPNINVNMYASQEKPKAVFAAMVSRLDVYVGQIVGKLQELGIEKNTIVMFASDNGPHKEGGADPVFFQSSGELRGAKRDLYEGGIRVPFIAWWPGTINGDRTSDHISAFWDVAPTLAELAGAGEMHDSDGISFLPELLGSDDQRKHDRLYWEFHEQGGKQAIRMGKWKGIRLNVKNNPDSPIALYNLEEDMKESQDIAKDHAEIVEIMKAAMDKERRENPIFPFIY